MSESERVQRWRQRQREAGKEPLTIWLTTAEKLRLEDQALSMRCSPSELVQRLLAQWQGESQAVTDTVTDTEQLRAVTDAVADTIRQELPLLVRLAVEELQLQSALPVTDTVTDTILQGVTDTVTAMRTSPLAHAGNIDVTATVTDTQSIVTFTVTDTEEAIEAADVTAAVTDTTISPTPKRKAPARQRPVTATITDTVTDTSIQTEAERVAIRALQGVTDTITDTSTEPAPAATDTVTDTESVTDTVTVTGHALEPFDTTKYVLGKLCPRGHAWGNTGKSLLRRTNRHCGDCDREKFHERKQAKRQQKERV